MSGFPEVPCEVCPRPGKGLPLPCRWQAMRTSLGCQRVASGHAGYIALTLGDEMPAVDPGSDPGPAPETTQAVPLADSLRLNRRMQVCPWRTTATDCGCGGLARCAVGLGRRGLVNHQDCHACLSRDPIS